MGGPGTPHIKTLREVARLARDIDAALSEIVERARLLCGASGKTDAVAHLPFFLLRRAHEQAVACMTLIASGLNTAVSANVRTVMETCFLVGALSSPRADEIARKYVAYELCADRSMHRMSIPGSIEHREVRPHWNATIPGLADVIDADRAREAVTSVNETLANLDLEAIAATFDKRLADRPHMLPSFTDLLEPKMTIYDIAEAAGLAALYKSVYWQLSETVHARDVVKGSFHPDGEHGIRIAGPIRHDRLAPAINTIVPILQILVETACRVPVLAVEADQLQSIWQTKVIMVERDLPTE